MYHYDPKIALEELTEDATLPNPVHVSRHDAAPTSFRR